MSINVTTPTECAGQSCAGCPECETTWHTTADGMRVEEGTYGHDIDLARRERVDRLTRWWAKQKPNQLHFAESFQLRFGGDFFPDHVAYDKHRGRWMRWDDRRLTWADGSNTILQDVASHVGELVDDQTAAKWLNLRTFNDVLRLSEGPMVISQDVSKDLLGLPGGQVYDLTGGYAFPNLNRLPVFRTTGASPDNNYICPIGNPCVCLWHKFLDWATQGDVEMEASSPTLLK